jgi:hypothetical protein
LKFPVLRSLLLVAGLIGATIGASLLLNPIAFQASTGITLPNNPSLLSEVRAPGGALLVSNLLITLGAFVGRLTFPATWLACGLYLSYGLSRLVSMLLDGIPETLLVHATIAELVIGGACAFALVKQRERLRQ